MRDKEARNQIDILESRIEDLKKLIDKKQDIPKQRVQAYRRITGFYPGNCYLFTENYFTDTQAIKQFGTSENKFGEPIEVLE